MLLMVTTINIRYLRRLLLILWKFAVITILLLGVIILLWRLQHLIVIVCKHASLLLQFYRVTLMRWLIDLRGVIYNATLSVEWLWLLLCVGVLVMSDWCGVLIGFIESCLWGVLVLFHGGAIHARTISLGSHQVLFRGLREREASLCNGFRLSQGFTLCLLLLRNLNGSFIIFECRVGKAFPRGQSIFRIPCKHIQH